MSSYRNFNYCCRGIRDCQMTSNPNISRLLSVVENFLVHVVLQIYQVWSSGIRNDESFITSKSMIFRQINSAISRSPVVQNNVFRYCDLYVGRLDCKHDDRGSGAVTFFILSACKSKLHDFHCVNKLSLCNIA